MRTLTCTLCALALFFVSSIPLRAQSPDEQKQVWEAFGGGKPDITPLSVPQSPYGNPRVMVDGMVALKLPTLYQRAYGPLPNGVRLPLVYGPDYADLGKATWKTWKFGDFFADGFGVPTTQGFTYKSPKQVRVTTYRPLPKLNRKPVPHEPSGLALGDMRIPVLNYSPDMVAGYPCIAGMSPREVNFKRPRVWFEAGGPRASGAALIPDDPCVTQRALDLAVFALSYASPDRSTREVLDGLKKIEERASDASFGYSDVRWLYNEMFLNPAQSFNAFYGSENPIHGGLSYFLPDGHTKKRLYWLLLHPHGDARLHPTVYNFDNYLLDVATDSEKDSPYWRQQQIGTDKPQYPILPWIGRVGVRFALYSPDDAVVCGRHVPVYLVPDVKQNWEMIYEFSMVGCEFAAGPHVRLEGSMLTQVVVYLTWDSNGNQWVFEDLVLGNSAWHMLAGINPVVPAVSKHLGGMLPAPALIHRLLPSYLALRP